MTFDPAINYCDKGLNIDENFVLWSFGELIKNLITLSSDADRQVDIIGYGDSVAEMAMDFEDHFTNKSNSYLDNNLLTENQNNALKELDRFFEDRSSEKYQDFWDDSQLPSNPDWVLVRQQAGEILKMLGMDNFDIAFDRVEKFETIEQQKRLVMQSTKTRLVDKNDSLHGFGASGADEQVLSN